MQITARVTVLTYRLCKDLVQGPGEVGLTVLEVAVHGPSRAEVMVLPNVPNILGFTIVTDDF